MQSTIDIFWMTMVWGTILAFMLFGISIVYMMAKLSEEQIAKKQPFVILICIIMGYSIVFLLSTMWK